MTDFKRDMLKKLTDTDADIITVTEFSWSVSPIVNLVHCTVQEIKISRRGQVIAKVVPINSQLLKEKNHV